MRLHRTFYIEKTYINLLYAFTFRNLGQIQILGLRLVQKEAKVTGKVICTLKEGSIERIMYFNEGETVRDVIVRWFCAQEKIISDGAYFHAGWDRPPS